MRFALPTLPRRRLLHARRWLAAAPLLGATIAPPAAVAQTTPLPSAAPTGAVIGRVTSAMDGTPLPAALIVVAGTALHAQTDDAGRYALTDIVPGHRTIAVRRAGFAEARRTVLVRSGAVDTVDFAVDVTPAALSQVTIIGSPSDIAETRATLARVPGATTLIEGPAILATRQANLKDVLQFTPGVYVQPRFGAADESQISIRGSGLRNNFHVRGVNLLVNGMPYRNADGFTDFESLELLTTETIEVYKGANALRYGGSTLGGAINLNTKTGYSARPLAAFAQSGSFGFNKAQLASGAVRGSADYYGSYARTELKGYRAWSDQARDRVNLHAGVKLSPTTDARAFYFFARVAEHLPGSVDRATLDSAPRSADPGHITDRWGRAYDLHHVGLQLRTQLTPTQRIQLSPYLQYRDIDHPIFEVINQQSRDLGVEARYENTTSIGAHDNRLTVGVQAAHETMHNRQFRNVRGEHGDLTRDEQDRATTVASYIEEALSLTPRLTATVGARVDRTTRRIDDAFLTTGNRTDSRSYTPITPRAGLHYTLPAGGQLFANASRTVEPPLLLELSSFGNRGRFLDLAAQEAWQYEIGARASRLGLAWEASFYDIELKHEILNLNVKPFANASFTVPSYRNAPRSRHAGAEVGVAYQLPGGVFVRDDDVRDHLSARVAYTYGRFTYTDDPTYSGRDIPGAPRHYLTTEVRYVHPSGFSLAPTIEWVPQAYFVNSANSMTNDPWTTLGVRVEWKVERAGVTAFVAGQNLTDRRYSQSVQVDNEAGKFFEPADGRSFYAGIRWTP
ncbi:MAG: TonB-dependent receptor [Gemmatimonadaceae bacterium]